MDLVSHGTDSKTQSILEFVVYVQQALDKSAVEIPTLTTHLEALIASPPHHITHEERVQLHQAGVELWNKCRHHGGDESPRFKTLLAQVRAFAYFLLRKPVESTSIRAGRICIDAEQYSLAHSILERISDSLSQEYALLRILLAWKQDKSSIADLFYTKLNGVGSTSAGADATSLFYEMGGDYLAREQHEDAKRWLERAYTTLQEHDWRSSFDGPELRLNVLHAYTRSLFTLDEYQESARDMLATLHSEYPQRLPVLVLKMEHYMDADELRRTLEVVVLSMPLMGSNFQLVIYHLHVLFKLDVKHACEVLGIFITKRLIPEAMADWLETSTLTLIWMVTQCSEADDADDMLRDVLSALRAKEAPRLSSEFVQAAVVLVWKRIEQASATDAQLAVKWCKVAIQLAHLNDVKDLQCEGKLSRRLVSCCVAANDYAGAHEALEQLSEDAKAHPLSRYLNYIVAMRSNDETMAERALASLASAPQNANKLLFACVSETDRYGSPKLQAKLLQRILDRHSNQPHPDVNVAALLRATARLLWQVLEQEKDHGLDEELLQRLCAVFKAAKNYSVRCNGGSPTSTTRNQGFDALECEWFSKNGYNLALKMVQHWPTTFILRILETVTHLAYPTGSSTPNEIQVQRAQRIKKIAYMRIILYTTEARKNGDVAAYTKIMTVYHSTIVVGIDNDKKEHRIYPLFAPLLPPIFEAALHSSGHLPEDRRSSLLMGIVTSLLPPPDSDTSSSRSDRSYAACADMVLRAATATVTATSVSNDGDGETRQKNSKQPSLSLETAVAVLSRIIAHVRTLHTYDVGQASRWIRCVVQLILDVDESAKQKRKRKRDVGKKSAEGDISDGNNAAVPVIESHGGDADHTTTDRIDVDSATVRILRDVLGEAAQFVTSLQRETDDDGTTAMGYPNDELEWLAATTFNLAVDMYVAERDAEGRELARMAMGFADTIAVASVGGEGKGMGKGKVGNGFAAMLRGRVARMGWGGVDMPSSGGCM